MKGKINFLALLIGFQLLSLEAGIVIENITLIDAKNGTRTNQTVSIAMVTVCVGVNQNVYGMC